MTFPGRRPKTSGTIPPAANRPLRGGPIPVTEDDLPFYAALVGRPTTADDRRAVLLSGFELGTDDEAGETNERRDARQGWGRVAGRVREMLSFLKRAG
jgi:hypothetical protein